MIDLFRSGEDHRHDQTDSDLSRRLALAVAMGMLIGLVPKDSLLAWLLLTLLLITTANFPCAAISGFLASWLGFLLDPFAHRLGGLLLTEPRLEAAWVWLYELPLMPWTRFNNTVVMGSLLTGILLFLPVYLLSHAFFRRFGKVLFHVPMAGRLLRCLAGYVDPDPEAKTA
jgi:uncharacterized protein (TIGR03546 family)